MNFIYCVLSQCPTVHQSDPLLVRRHRMLQSNTYLNVERVNNITVATFINSSIFTKDATGELARNIHQLVDERPMGMVLVFTSVLYLSTTGVHSLFMTCEAAKRVAVQMKLCGIQPSVLKTFKLTGLTEAFDIHEDRETALASFPV
ncbi:MAG: anti-anti-sigma factor [Candidatus Peribacteria bacterium]|nr:anti-anti-sigma factor [Candidatus Peribacteria bacterium]